MNNSQHEVEDLLSNMRHVPPSGFEADLQSRLDALVNQHSDRVVSRLSSQPAPNPRAAISKRGVNLLALAIPVIGLMIVGISLILISLPVSQPVNQPVAQPTISPIDLMANAEAAYAVGDLDMAVEWYRQAAALFPDDLDIAFKYGQMLVLASRYEDAVAVSDRMILLAPEDVRGYLVRSHALDWMGEFNQAEAEALKALQIDPDHALAHAYLAEAYLDLGRLEVAREEAEIAVALDPFDIEVRRVYALWFEHSGDYEGAILQYLHALELEPNRLDLWYRLASTYRVIGQFDKSIETFSQIAMRTPNDPKVYENWGRTYFMMGDGDAAQTTLKKAVDLTCMQGQEEEHIPVANYRPCPYLTSDEIFNPGEEGKWTVEQAAIPLENQLPWVSENRSVPPYVRISAWSKLGQVYISRRSYEEAVAILSEAIAWGEDAKYNNPAGDGYQHIPIELYYMLATAYYYKSMCNFTVPLARIAFEKYEHQELIDQIALTNILKLFVLCRDYPGGDGTPVIYTGEGFGEDGFPDGYEEPDILIESGAESTTESIEESNE